MEGYLSGFATGFIQRYKLSIHHGFLIWKKIQSPYGIKIFSYLIYYSNGM